MTVHPYQFRPMTAADLPLVRRWLTEPHVAQWWGNADEQYEIVRQDLDHPAMHQFIVAADDRPFGYIQCYDQKHGKCSRSAPSRTAPAASTSSWASRA